MDADDIAMKERLSIQYSIADQHPEIGVLSNWFYRITAAGQVKRLVKLPEQHDAIETMMTRSCSILFGSSMIRKSLIEQIRGFDCKHYAEDWDLFLKLLPLTRFYNVQEPLLFYRQHSNTITGRYRVFQRQDSYVISHDYLLRKFESANSLIERRQIVFRLAVSEISLGTITSARKYLLEAFKIGERSFYWLVYFIFCLLGDRNVSFMRNVRDTAKRVMLRYGWNVK
jgi:hypothetical protein